ncbi:MAG: leucyl aminopeptidase family protein [Sphingomonadales bacterium]
MKQQRRTCPAGVEDVFIAGLGYNRTIVNQEKVKSSMHKLPDCFSPTAAKAVPVHVLDEAGFKAWRKSAPAHQRRWAEGQSFAAQPGRHLVLPDPAGGLHSVLFGASTAPTDGPWPYAALAAALPPGRYRLIADWSADQAQLAALGWALGHYQFSRYKKPDPTKPRQLVLPAQVDAAAVRRAYEGTALVRDLVNTPAADMGPTALAAAARAVARRFNAQVKVTVGDALLKAGLPTIHAVGRAAADAPRLIDLRWGPPRAPKVTLVGKGVCFDSGGLDLKPSAGMRWMKKDMGGAAHALALAQMIMDAGLKVRLRLLIPAVENAVSGNAFRPGDIIKTRKGLHVEIGNTDAEGRLVLCDALALADAEKPALMLDFATLTGAARVALGGDLPALFSDDDALAADFAAAGAAHADPSWRLPLWPPYKAKLKSPIADLCNVADSGLAGAITAALYLQHFVEQAQSWAHIDLYAWHDAAKPGRPKGGEAMSLRAAFAVIAARFGGQ